MRSNKLRVVSFSGIDGAGKSTQIQALRNHLQSRGMRVECREFWDDVVAFSRLREFLSHRVLKGDRGVGSPENPINRRDKNVRGWHLTIARLFLYTLDAIHLRAVVAGISEQVDVVIFDRYIFDEMANLPLDSWSARFFVRLLVTLSPKPDVAMVLDADPDDAYARKPEYPVQFLHVNRDAYVKLSRIVGGIDIVESSLLEPATQAVAEIFASKCLRAKSAPPLKLVPVPLTIPHARSQRR